MKQARKLHSRFFIKKNKIKHTHKKKLVDFDSVNIVQDKFFLGRIKIY